MDSRFPTISASSESDDAPEKFSEGEVSVLDNDSWSASCEAEEPKLRPEGGVTVNGQEVMRSLNIDSRPILEGGEGSELIGEIADVRGDMVDFALRERWGNMVIS